MRYWLLVVPNIAVAAPAAALELPPRKAGLWEIRMIFDGRNLPPQTMKQCVDAATDKLMSSFGGDMRQDMCPRQDVKKVGNTMVVDTVCRVDDIVMTSHGVITGDFNSAYTVKVTIKREGGPPEAGPASTTNMTIDAKWTGACSPGMKPGDIIMPDGSKMNIRELQ